MFVKLYFLVSCFCLFVVAGTLASIRDSSACGKKSSKHPTIEGSVTWQDESRVSENTQAPPSVPLKVGLPWRMGGYDSSESISKPDAPERVQNEPTADRERRSMFFKVESNLFKVSLEINFGFSIFSILFLTLAVSGCIFMFKFCENCFGENFDLGGLTWISEPLEKSRSEIWIKTSGEEPLKPSLRGAAQESADNDVETSSQYSNSEQDQSEVTDTSSEGTEMVEIKCDEMECEELDEDSADATEFCDGGELTAEKSLQETLITMKIPCQEKIECSEHTTSSHNVEQTLEERGSSSGTEDSTEEDEPLECHSTPKKILSKNEFHSTLNVHSPVYHPNKQWVWTPLPVLDSILEESDSVSADDQYENEKIENFQNEMFLVDKNATSQSLLNAMGEEPVSGGERPGDALGEEPVSGGEGPGDALGEEPVSGGEGPGDAMGEEPVSGGEGPGDAMGEEPVSGGEGPGDAMGEEPVSGGEGPGDAMGEEPVSGGEGPGDAMGEEPVSGGEGPGDAMGEEPVSGGEGPGDAMGEEPVSGGEGPGDAMGEEPVSGGEGPGDALGEEPVSGGEGPGEAEILFFDENSSESIGDYNHKKKSRKYKSGLPTSTDSSEYSLSEISCGNEENVKKNSLASENQRPDELLLLGFGSKESNTACYGEFEEISCSKGKPPLIEQLPKPVRLDNKVSMLPTVKKSIRNRELLDTDVGNHPHQLCKTQSATPVQYSGPKMTRRQKKKWKKKMMKQQGKDSLRNSTKSKSGTFVIEEFEPIIY